MSDIPKIVLGKAQEPTASQEELAQRNNGWREYYVGRRSTGEKYKVLWNFTVSPAFGSKGLDFDQIKTVVPLETNG